MNTIAAYLAAYMTATATVSAKVGKIQRRQRTGNKWGGGKARAFTVM